MKFFLTLLPLLAFAAPQGLHVMSGSAEIVGGEVRVTESSVLHWDSYSIAAHEHIHYPSPHPTLNRVTSDLPSEIYGRLSSNGPLWLINPNGIVIGENGRINAASFLASTLDLLDGPEFIFAGDRGRIEQHGVIECPGGYVTLLSAESVVQTGEIHAKKVAIGVGREILFTPKDSPLIAIRQSGLEKPGFAAGIQCKGLIEATGFEERGGEIYLVADRVVVEKETMLCGSDVRVLGKEVAEFYGEIEAPGGFAEVSSPRQLVFEPVRVQTRGPNGERGKLLLDPSDIVITASTNDGFMGSCPTFTPNADTMNISVTTLQACLEGPNDVVLSATSGLAGAGNITASTAVLSWNSSGSLTLEAERAITISASGGLQCAGSGNITLTASGTAEGTYAGITVTAPVETATGTVTLSGTGGTTGGNGIVIADPGSVSSTGGDIEITGTSMGTASSSFGISLQAGSAIAIGDGGTLTLHGTGGVGAATSSCHGIFFSAGTLTIGNTTGATAIFTGVGGGGTGGGNRGVSLINPIGAITMNGASTLCFKDCVGGGTGGGGNSSTNYGVHINESITTSASGAEITFANITGGGLGTGSSNYGLFIDNAAVSAPVIRMDATNTTNIRGGVGSGADNTGILISGASGALGNSMVTSEISLIASSLGTGSSNHGISMSGGSINIADGGTLTLDGTAGGGASSNSCMGISLSGGGSTLTVGNTTGATAIFTGVGGGGTGGSNHGVNFASTMTAVVVNGASTLHFTDCVGGGTAGGGNSGLNHGVFLNKNISLTAGEILFGNITGGGIGTGINNNGLQIQSATVAAPSIKMDSEMSIIRGGVGSGNPNCGISLSVAALGSNTGPTATLEMTLKAGNLGPGVSPGILMSNSSINIADGGILTLHGTGGGSASSNSGHGISLSSGTLNIGAVSGATAILTGVGRGGSSGLNRGVHIGSGTSVVMNGASKLLFQDCTGGGILSASNSSNNAGVYINTPIVTSAAGAEIAFANITGGGLGTGTNNYGLFIDNVEVSAPIIHMDATDMTGIRGGNTTGAGNHGIFMNTSLARLGSSTTTTSIDLVGLAGGTGTSEGIKVDGASKIQSAGTITLSGTGASGSSSASYGIQAVTTGAEIVCAGDMTLTGAILSSGTTQAIRLASGGRLTTTGSGDIDLNITGAGAVGLGSSSQINSASDILFDAPVEIFLSTPVVNAVGAITFADTIDGAFAMNVSADTIDLQGIVGGTTPVGALSLTGTSAIQVANNISTNNSNLTFTGPVALTGNSTMATSGGAIHFTSTLDGAQDLTLDAGAGTITFSDVVGGTTPLGTFEATASNVFLNADITAVQGTFDANVTVMGDPSLKAP